MVPMVSLSVEELADVSVSLHDRGPDAPTTFLKFGDSLSVLFRGPVPPSAVAVRLRELADEIDGWA